MDASSPFSPHFNTNYIPSDPEINDIRSIIQSHQVIIDDIEKQMRELEDRRRLHTKVVEQHSILLSPMKRMPTDILSSIFLACLPRRHFYQGMPMSKQHPTVIICHVCQQWRRVALESPLLWNRIHLGMPLKPHPRYSMRNRLTEAAGALFKLELLQYERKLQVIKDMAFEWIHRSAHCPLEIAFFWGESSFGRHALDDSGDDDIFSEPIATNLPRQSSITPFLVDLLLSVASRWRRVSFNLNISSSDCSLLRLLETPTSDVSQLEDLQIVLNLPETYVEENRLLRVGLTSRMNLLKAPRLRSLVLGRLWAPGHTLPVNWAALTELCLGSVLYGPGMDSGALDPSHTLTVLKACPNLVRCMVTMGPEFRFDIPGPGGIFSNAASSTPLPLDEKITLRHLTSMSIQGAALPCGFASSLNLPSLSILSVMCQSATPQNEEQSGFVDWVRTFGDTLTEVAFEHSALTQSALLYCLERLPHVVTLRMLDTGTVSHGNWDAGAESPRAALLTDSILERLTPQSDSSDDASGDSDQCLCPHLQNLSCRMTEMEFTENGLLEFIVGRRRRNITSPVKRVVIKFNMAQKMNIRKELEDRGVDLEGFSSVIKYNEGPPALFLRSDEGLDQLLPEDRMVASSFYMMPHGTDWWL
ncbi:hypothetical protein EST38_g8171 [Candolleomyces aberdarensis]|uniref:Uncharacterized protein n=1 Tax=Candolleomyces aberdarensis TaxID=2316362 RepID=A0A4Q2DG28_9AGAR|nr:hypothetical protein EST38_g8171 [Candolleomyces aberdarensis]